MKLIIAQDHVLSKLKKLGALDVVVNSTSGEENQLKFVNNEIVMNQNWDDNSLSVFASRGERGSTKTGVTSLNFSTKSELDGQLEKFWNFIKKTPINKNYFDLAEGNFKYKIISGIYDDEIKNIGLKGTSMLSDAIDLSLQKGIDRVGGTLSYGHGTQRILTSKGIDESYDSTNISLSIRAMISESSAHKVVNSRNLKNFKYRPKILELAEQAKLGIGAEKIKPGRYSIVFEPLSFANIVNEIGRSTVADAVDTGSSFLKGKLNKEVSSKIFSLYDVGNLSNGLASRPFDAEGRATRATELISSGTLKTFLTNTSSANRFNLTPTGNAGILYPHPTNLVVPIGKRSSSKLISGLDNGLVVTNSWYHRYQNYLKGDFSVIPRDAIFVVKEGRIIGSAKDIRISGNMLKIMENISELSNSKERIISWEASIPSEVPSARINNVNVTVV